MFEICGLAITSTWWPWAEFLEFGAEICARGCCFLSISVVVVTTICSWQRNKLHQHRPQTVGYTLGHILCLFPLNATDLRCLCEFIWFLSPNGDDMPVWFQSAPGLDHDYGQITTSVVLLGVQVADVRRGYLEGRRRRRRRVPAPAPASPGTGAGAGAGITS